MPAALFAILISAFRSALGFLLRSIIVKFVTFFALFYIVSEFMNVLMFSGLMGRAISGATTVQGAFDAIPAGVWYLLSAFMVPTGISIIVSAYATRFIIRRIPLIG